MKNKLQKIVFESVKTIWPETKLALEEIEISIPPEGFGDYSCNVAMKLATKLKKNPLEIAQKIAEKIAAKFIENVKVVQPGHINIYLSDKVFLEGLLLVKKEGENYGKNDSGKGKQVMVEFGQPNTHKAFHVGHLRSAISGLAVSNLFEAAGFQVIRANYFGDVGMHVAKTTWAMMRKREPEGLESLASTLKMKYIDQMYVEGARAFKEDENAQAQIRQINQAIYQKDDARGVFSMYEKIRNWSLEHHKEIFNQLGIKYDRQYPESEVYAEAIEIVKQNIGEIFKQSQGAVIYDGQSAGLTTWVFLTKEGVPTYSAKDLALAAKKFSEYDLDLSIVTTSVEQIDYFKVVIKCLELVDPKLEGKYRHIPFGWLLRGGKKTSSRMGETVKGADVIEEAKKMAEQKIAVAKEYDDMTKTQVIEKVAMSGLKFLILSHEFHNNINYDPDDFIKLKGFSGPFILYSYVRIRSVLRKVAKAEKGDFDASKTSLTAEEKNLAKELLNFPDVIKQAGVQIAPHLICNYLYLLAQKFNLFYENCPIQKAENENSRLFRLALASATGQVLKNGLNILGIETTEVM